MSQINLRYSPLIVAAMFLLLPLTNHAQDWTQWRGPNRDGIAPAVASAWPKDLKEEWKVTL